MHGVELVFRPLSVVAVLIVATACGDNRSEPPQADRAPVEHSPTDEAIAEAGAHGERMKALRGSYRIVKDKAWWTARDLEHSKSIEAHVATGAIMTLEQQHEAREGLLKAAKSATIVLTLHEDSTYTMDLGHGPVQKGRWRLEANRVVLEDTQVPAPREGMNYKPTDWTASFVIRGDTLDRILPAGLSRELYKREPK